MADRSVVIQKIREHYAALGIPLDELSDRDVEMGVRQLADAAREAGTDPEQATAAMRVAVETAKRQREAREAEAQAAADAAEADAAEADGAETDGASADGTDPEVAAEG